MILYHLNAKLSIRRDGTARGPVPEVAPSGGVETNEFSRDVGLAAAPAGFGLRAEQSRGRLMLRTYAVSEAAAAAAAEAKSSGGGIDPADGSTDLVVR